MVNDVDDESVGLFVVKFIDLADLSVRFKSCVFDLVRDKRQTRFIGKFQVWNLNVKSTFEFELS